MLRFYKPIDKDEIFQLHVILEHLIVDVWCKADSKSCSAKMNADLKKLITYIYKNKKTFGYEIVRIYILFKDISQADRDKISEAIKQAGQIDKLCDRTINPILLADLHNVVKSCIKPLFKWCYEDLLDRKKVSGDKLIFYKTLNGQNNFNYCPCCGLIDFEDYAPENKVRESYDHYLPKSEYPLASVSFKNLVPLCYKCNSERKKAKNPIENTRKAYYPFSKNPENHSIDISTTFELGLDELNQFILEDVIVTLGGDLSKSDTWDWLFAIKDRYASKMANNSKTFLRELKSRYRNKLKIDKNATYEDVLQEEIELFKCDIYDDWKFLKIPIINQLLDKDEFLEVYN